MAIQHGGRYKARAIAPVNLGTSKEKGTPFVECYFEITDGENKGGRARWTAYFTEKSAERTIESLQIAGWGGDDVGEFADGELHGLDANEVEIVVELEEYEKDGEKRVTPRVQWVNRLGGYLNVQNAMTKEAAASFGDRMKGLVLKVREKSGSKPAGDGTDFNYGANAKDAPPPKATGTEQRKAF